MKDSQLSLLSFCHPTPELPLYFHFSLEDLIIFFPLKLSFSFSSISGSFAGPKSVGTMLPCLQFT